MTDILQQILTNKRTEVAAAKSTAPSAELRNNSAFAQPPRDFFTAVATPAKNHPALIAEIKAKSPSAGVIRDPLNVAAIAKTYEESGAAALSVLTDKKYFGGSVANIAIAKAACNLPVLRKEFIVDEYQIIESRAIGADAILLISEALPPDTVIDFTVQAAALDLAVLIEGHSAEVLQPIVSRLQKENPPRVLIGINNRDLKRQITDIAIFSQVAKQIGNDFPHVAESGIRTRTDVARLQADGAAAMLVGETLLKSADIAEKIAELCGPEE